MRDDQTTRPKAVAQKQEPIFVLRVIRIVYQAAALVEKNGLRFLERDAMLYEIRLGLAPVPGQLDIAHSIILAISINAPARRNMQAPPAPPRHPSWATTRRNSLPYPNRAGPPGRRPSTPKNPPALRDCARAPPAPRPRPPALGSRSSRRTRQKSVW